MAKKMFMIAGLVDIEKAGNQSIKNCIKYLLDSGYRIEMFNFMPETYPNLQNPKDIFRDGAVRIHRLPWLLLPIVYLGKTINDLIGKKKRDAKQADQPISSLSGTYLTEYTWTGRLLDMVFLFLVYAPLELIRVSAHCIKGRPDIVYGVNCQGAFVAGIFAAIFKRPLVTKFNGASISEYDLQYWQRRLLLLDEISGLKAGAAAVIMANDGTKGDRVLNLLGIKDSRIKFLMNGFDSENLKVPDEWDPGKFKQELGLSGKKIMLMASRLASWKRADRGLFCMDQLVNREKKTDAVLLLIGDGPERENLESLRSELKLENNVIFCGLVPHKDIYKYFTIADIFLSLYDVSNLGNPLLEALYFGKPVVTIDDGSTDRLLTGGENSFLISKKDLGNELAKKVSELLSNDGLRKTMGHNARSAFDRHVLSWHDRMRIEEDIIKQAMDDYNKAR